jgi:hypothetical protein
MITYKTTQLVGSFIRFNNGEGEKYQVSLLQGELPPMDQEKLRQWARSQGYTINYINKSIIKLGVLCTH